MHNWVGYWKPRMSTNFRLNFVSQDFARGHFHSRSRAINITYLLPLPNRAMSVPNLSFDDIEGTLTALARYRAVRHRRSCEFAVSEILAGLSETMTPVYYENLATLIAHDGPDLERYIPDLYERPYPYATRTQATMSANKPHEPFTPTPVPTRPTMSTKSHPLYSEEPHQISTVTCLAPQDDESRMPSLAGGRITEVNEVRAHQPLPTTSEDIHADVSSQQQSIIQGL